MFGNVIIKRCMFNRLLDDCTTVQRRCKQSHVSVVFSDTSMMVTSLTDNTCNRWQFVVGSSAKLAVIVSRLVSIMSCRCQSFVTES